MRNFYIVTGGTFSDISPHFSVCARAFGTVGSNPTLARLGFPKLGLRVHDATMPGADRLR